MLSENSLAVTGLNMISEHCTAAAATPAASIVPAETVSTPAAAQPAAEPASIVATPAVAAPAGAAPASAAPAAVVSTPSETASAPAALFTEGGRQHDLGKVGTPLRRLHPLSLSAHRSRTRLQSRLPARLRRPPMHPQHLLRLLRRPPRVDPQRCSFQSSW